MDWSAIGKRIRQQREYMGLTREQFAEQIDVTPKFCADIETGAKGMSVPTLSTDYILYGITERENPDAVTLMLENCSENERAYAEQLLKTFVAAMNMKDEEKALL